MNKTTRRLFTVIEQLSEEEAKEVLDFTEFLLSRKRTEKQDKKLDLEKNPILDLIGLADFEPFSEAIDEELYGRKNNQTLITLITLMNTDKKGVLNLSVFISVICEICVKKEKSVRMRWQ